MNYFAHRYATPDRHFVPDFESRNNIHGLLHNPNLNSDHIHKMIDKGMDYEMSERHDLNSDHIHKIANLGNSSSTINLIENKSIPFHQVKQIFNKQNENYKNSLRESMATRHDIDDEMANDLVDHAMSPKATTVFKGLVASNPAVKGTNLQKIVSGEYPSVSILKNPNLSDEQIRTLIPKFPPKGISGTIATKGVASHPNTSDETIHKLITNPDITRDHFTAILNSGRRLDPFNISEIHRISNTKGMLSVDHHLAKRSDLSDENVTELMKNPGAVTKQNLLDNPSIQHHPDIQKAKNA